MSTELTAGNTEFTDDEFRKILKRLDKMIADVRTTVQEACMIFARMSDPQYKEAKKRYRGVWPGDQIPRMRAAGMGEIAPWLAMRPNSLPISVLKNLPIKAKEILQDPKNEVEFLTPTRGVQLRPVGGLNGKELNQVVDPEKGILKAEGQAKRMLSLSKITGKEPPEDDIEDPVRLVVSRDRKYIHSVGAHVTHRIPVKTLRGILGK